MKFISLLLISTAVVAKKTNVYNWSDTFGKVARDDPSSSEAILWSSFENPDVQLCFTTKYGMTKKHGKYYAGEIGICHGNNGAKDYVKKPKLVGPTTDKNDKNVAGAGNGHFDHQSQPNPDVWPTGADCSCPTGEAIPVDACEEFDITVNGQSTDTELFLDDSIGFLDLEIASNQDADIEVRFHKNHAHMFTSTCSISTTATEGNGLQCVSTDPRSNDSWCNQNCLDHNDEFNNHPACFIEDKDETVHTVCQCKPTLNSSTVTLTTDLVSGNCKNAYSVIRLEYGPDRQCHSDIKVSRKEKEKGTCHSSGDPHTKTFDNAMHDWGNYDYVNIFKGCDLMVLGKHNLTNAIDTEQPIVGGTGNGLQCVSTDPRSTDYWCNQNCLDHKDEFNNHPACFIEDKDETVHTVCQCTQDAETTPITMSMYEGFKFQYKNTMITIDIDDENVPQIYTESVDSKELESIEFSESTNRYHFKLPDGSKITVHVRGTAKVGIHLDIKLELSARYKELCSAVSLISGVCGNWDGDKQDDGYTPSNISPTGPWKSSTYAANPSLPETSFPSHVSKLRCDSHVDGKKEFVATFPTPPTSRRRSAAVKMERRTIDHEEMVRTYEHECKDSVREIDHKLYKFFDECEIDLTKEIQNCAMDMFSIGEPANVARQVLNDLESCPAFEQFLTSKQNR
eukprot:Awhi_evm1s11639